MSQVKGQVKRVFSASPVDGKRLVIVDTSAGGQIKAFGDFPSVEEGLRIILTGHFENQSTVQIFITDKWREDRDAALFSGTSPFSEDDSSSLFESEEIDENEFVCTVERITFQSDTSGFQIMKVRPDGRKDTVTVCGTLPGVRPGLRVHVEGSWTVHQKYGRQFNCDSFEVIVPSDAQGIQKYLSSGVIKGIGKVSAKKIVAHFGDDTLKILDEDPTRIHEVKGLKEKKKETIIKNWRGAHIDREVMVFLGKHGLPITMSSKIIMRYGLESMDVLKSNPYTLADDISGIGFKTADLIAMGMGIKPDDSFRIRCGVRHAMLQTSMDGNTYTTRAKVLSIAESVLEIEPEKIMPVIEQMTAPVLIQEGVDADIIDDHDCLYLKPYYRAEAGVARLLSRLMQSAPSKEMSSAEIDFDDIQKKTGVEYDDFQKQAIRTAIDEKVSVITGGPGTGKTTITNAIITALKQKDCEIVLVAPTGRAAKRLSQATGMRASTIHKLLDAGEHGFAKNESEQVTGDVIIIDESSMVDVILMYHLMQALPMSMKMIIVGDVDQLPSVGCGNVLRDVIDSEVVPTVRLQRIYRQGDDSRIISNAHLINDGKMPVLSNGQNTDFFFIHKEEPDEIRDTIVDLVINRLPAAYNVYPNDIQILSPMRKTVIGVTELNLILQKKINPGDPFYKREDIELKVSDKVIQTKNDYYKKVSNGDIGFIESVKKDEDGEFESAEVRFEDDRVVTYEKEDLEELELAYATTVHKSQGSEYPIVVIPVSTVHHLMLRRNLLYTAVTRAKKICVLVGTRQAIHEMVSNDDIVKRFTRLRDRLRAECGLID